MQEQRSEATAWQVNATPAAFTQPTPPSSEENIPVALDTVDNIVEQVRQVVHTLHHRLESVLKPIPPPEQQSMSAQGERAPHGVVFYRLLSQAQSLAEVRDICAEMLDRLEV